MPVVRISDELFRAIQKYAEPLVDNFETAAWKAIQVKRPDISSLDHLVQRSMKKPLIPPQELWKPILEALHEADGTESRKDVHNAVEKKMRTRLKPGDYELNRDGTTKWSKQLDYQRLAMVHEGLLESNSPRGIWEISNQGIIWLSQH